MNTNQFIQKNWMGAIGLVVFLIFVYFMFGPDRNVADRNQSSFLTGDGTTEAGIGNDGTNLGTSLPTTVPQPQAGAGEAIQWCVLLDGANHIPDLFGQGVDNGNGGTNWHSNGAEDPKGPHGVFTEENGKTVFFVKKSYLDQNGASPLSAELKTNVAGWRALSMTWANVAGEQALVYVK